jgi:hypothetical protein
MTFNHACVGLARRVNLQAKIPIEQSCSGFARLESSKMSEHFISVESCHPYGGDLAGSLTEVQIGSPVHLNTAISQKDASFGVVRKT